MKQFDAEAGGRKWLPSRASRLASATAVVALGLIAASSAKAVEDIETFTVSGSLGGPPFGPSVSLQGTFDLDFGNNFANFADPSLNSIDIIVNGRSVFTQGVSVSLGFISASNSNQDRLSLWFTTPSPGTWAGFNANEGEFSFGDVVFGDLTGSIFGAAGVITLSSGPSISEPPPITITDPPPPVIDPPPVAVPELSTWAMMLIGLAGLGLAARRRRAISFLGGKA
jgi:MYXO-CTERM domain-containing protein